jgi:hypothetical protein
MPSIIPEFEYDIFISYRQNDNQYDGWVTEFVTKLKQELEAMVKDKLTVYFDANPKDGIRDTDQVDESINTKLKSLIFIPIVSQTYCDTSSFAWQQEFLAFRNAADTDKLNRNVTLPNGNVASRILPIKIHDIEVDDVRLLEKELGGILRSVDFIYSSSGVNRSLRAKDDDFVENRHQILYRNQINKVANAIKEILTGIKNAEAGIQPVETNTTVTEIPPIQQPDISTTLPEAIRVAVINQEKQSIFLAWTSQELKAEREEMAIILQKAGFNVLPMHDCPADDDEFKNQTHEAMKRCNGTLHMLGSSFGRRFEADEDISFPQYQLEEAMKIAGAAEDFHTFVWYNPDPAIEVKQAQKQLITNVRNNITKNMTFSNASGAMSLVDDMRVMMKKQEVDDMNAKDTDIFFIFSQQDETEAQRITDLISTEYPVEVMNILPDGEQEYRELSKQQIPKSKLAVIYFKYAADWALPFIKQIWKQVGGASSPTPFMLIGEDDPKSNMARTFKAPKVVSTVVPNDEVHTEVKKVYIKVINL